MSSTREELKKQIKSVSHLMNKFFNEHNNDDSAKGIKLMWLDAYEEQLRRTVIELVEIMTLAERVENNV